MFRHSANRIKSAIALLIILVMLIVPWYHIQPVDASTTQDFYGGAMPSTNGGMIVSLTFDYFAYYADSGAVVSLMQGSTVICNYTFGVSAGSGTVTRTPIIYQNLTAGFTYTFVYKNTPYLSVSNAYVTFTPLWRVTYSTSGLDSSIIGSNTVVTVDGVSVPYSSFPYTTYVPNGNTTSYSYSSFVNSTTVGKQFALVSTIPSSPQTVSSAVDVTGTYLAFSPSSTYHTTIKGPYYEDGSIATGNTVSYVMSYVNGTVYSGSVTSTGSAGSVNLTSLSAFVELSWNATSVSSTFNATRVYRFANGQNGIDDSTVYLYILNPNKPAYQYTFSITDFYGMVNPYLQSSVSSDGNASHVVERVSLKDGGGFVTFVMQQYQLYSLSFVCQQGTYSQDFTPILLGTPGQNVVSLSVTAGNFPVSNSTGVIVYSANRTSSNTIYATYFDPNGTTTWVNMAITHLQGSSTIVDYASANSTGNSQSWSWSQADPNTNYYVTITASVGGTVNTYRLAVPSVNGDNPWAGIDWSNIGKYVPTLPVTYTGWGGIDPNQMIAVFLILAALGIGSYFSTGASCLICWVIGGILLAMGWWQGSIPLFAFALVITILILIDEYKKGNFAL